MPKKKVRKNKKTVVSKRSDSKKKMNMVFRRLIFFLIFFVLFLVLDAVISNDMWDNFLGIATWIFGFICAALLLVLLILWFMKIIKK